MPAALTWTRTSLAPGTRRGTSRTLGTSIPPYESNCTALGMKRDPILRLYPRLKVAEGDVGELTAERGAIHRKTDAVEPFVHLNGILAHALADNIERNLEIAECAPRNPRQNRPGLLPLTLSPRALSPP